MFQLAAAAPTPAVLVWRSRHFHADSFRMSHDLYMEKCNPPRLLAQVLQDGVVLLGGEPDTLVGVAARESQL